MALKQKYVCPGELCLFDPDRWHGAHSTRFRSFFDSATPSPSRPVSSPDSATCTSSIAAGVLPTWTLGVVGAVVRLGALVYACVYGLGHQFAERLQGNTSLKAAARTTLTKLVAIAKFVIWFIVWYMVLLGCSDYVHLLSKHCKGDHHVPSAPGGKGIPSQHRETVKWQRDLQVTARTIGLTLAAQRGASILGAVVVAGILVFEVAFLGGPLETAK